MITTWDARCGVAEYSRYLIHATRRYAPDLDFLILGNDLPRLGRDASVPVIQCWQSYLRGDLQQACREALRAGVSVVHFQFNFGFFRLSELANAIQNLKSAGLGVMMTFHSTQDAFLEKHTVSLREIIHALEKVDALLVHSQRDVQQFTHWGLTRNVYLVPHGNLVSPPENRDELRQFLGLPQGPVVGTFGFLLPHKGFLELAQAIQLLREEYPQILLLAPCAVHDDPVSLAFHQDCLKCLQGWQLNEAVFLISEFLDPEEAVLLLQATDVVVLPYKATVESTSASIRFALAAGRPVITTDVSVFDDVAAATYRISSSDPKEIATAIRAVLRNETLAEKLTQQAQRYTQATSWDRIAELYIELVQSI